MNTKTLLIYLLLLFQLNVAYALIGIASVKGVDCEGEPNGEVSFYIYGNAGTYSYEIIDENKNIVAKGVTNGISTNLIKVADLTKGNYTLRVLKGFGQQCETIRKFSIKNCCEEEPKNVEIKLEDKNYNASAATGYIRIQVVPDAQDGYYFHWTHKQTGTHFTTQNLEDLTYSGEYCVVVTDGCNSAEACFMLSECGDTDSFTISGSVTPENSTGSNDGAIDLSILGTAPFDIEWFDENGGLIAAFYGVSDGDIYKLTSGTYKVRVANADGCRIAYFTVYSCSMGVSAITPNATIKKPIPSSASNGSIVLDLPAGQSSSVSYFWTAKKSQQTFTDRDLINVPADLYCVTIKDELCGTNYQECYDLGFSCSFTLNSTIMPACPIGGSIEIFPIGSKKPPFTIVWSNGANAGLLLTDLSAGTYSVTVSDLAGCATTGQYKVPNKRIVLKDFNVECAETTSTVNIEASTDGDPTCATCTFTWSDGYVGKIRSNIPGGVYSVIIENSVGCKELKVVNVYDLNATITKVCEANSGSITLPPSPPLSSNFSGVNYLWSNAGTILSSNNFIDNLSAGTYTVVLSGNNHSCTATKQFILTNDGVVLKNPNTECAETTSTINIEASTAGDLTCSTCTFTWSDGFVGKTRSNIPVGDYTVEVKNSVGCVATKKIKAYDIKYVTVDACVNPINGIESGGVIAVNMVGNYSYLWNTGATVNHILSAYSNTPYTVTITDNQIQGCSFSKTMSVGKLNPNSIDFKLIQPCKGEIGLVSIKGGLAPYVLEVDGNLVNSNWDGQPFPISGYKDNVFVYVRDVRSCVITKYVSFKGSGPKLSLETDYGCPGGKGKVFIKVADPSYKNGTIYTINVNNSPTLTYTWNLDKIPFSGNTGEIYNVTVTSNSGCSEKITIKIPATVEPIASFKVGDTCNKDENNGVIKLVSGKSDNFYTWSNGSVNSSQSGLSPGIYTVTVTNPTGLCQNSVFSYTVGAFDFSAADKSIIKTPECPGQKDGNLELVFNAVNLTCLWSNSVNTKINPNLPAGNYELTLTDGDRCNLTFNPIVLGNLNCENPPVDFLCGPCGKFCRGNEILPNSTDLSNSALITQINNKDGSTLGSVVVATNLPNATFTLKKKNNSGSIIFSTGSIANPTTTISNLPVGSYILVINGPFPCVKSYNFDIEECDDETPKSIDFTIQPFFTQTNKGYIYINNFTSGYYFNWTGPNGFQSNARSITGLEAGDYTVTISPNCPELIVQTFTIKRIQDCDGPSVSFKTKDACNCSVCPKGSILASLKDANDYTYFWFPTGTQSLAINSASAGKYRLKLVSKETGCDFYYDTEVKSFDVSISKVENSCDIEYACNGKTYTEKIDPIHSEPEKNGGLCDVRYFCADFTSFVKDDVKWDWHYTPGIPLGIPIETNNRICQAEKICKNGTKDIIVGKWESKPEPENCRVYWTCVFPQSIPELSSLDGYEYDDDVKMCSNRLYTGAIDDIVLCECHDFILCNGLIIAEIDIPKSEIISGYCDDIKCKYEGCPLVKPSEEVLAKVKIVQNNSTFALIPNPTSDYFSVLMNSENDTEGNIELLTIDGRLIKKEKINIEKGKNIREYRINELIHYQGIIIVKVRLANGRLFTEKLVKI